MKESENARVRQEGKTDAQNETEKRRTEKRQ